MQTSSSSGKVAVGHPVDVASGTLFTEFEDVMYPGRVPLVFGRRYSTALLGRPAGMFGPSWSSPFEMRILRDLDGYRMIAEDGETEVPFAVLEEGETVRNLGACCELRREGPRLTVRRWQTEVQDVEELVFKVGKDGEWWPLVSRQTLDGQGIDIEHDRDGRVASVRQRREGRSLALTYNSRGRVEEVYLVPRPANGQGRRGQGRLVLRYSYDEQGLLAEMQDAQRNRCRYAYDDAGRMKREVTLAGVVHSFRFDAAGRCVLTTAQDGFGETTLEYDTTARITRVGDALGNITTFQCNAQGQVERVISPLGAVRSTVYDSHGRIIQRIDPVGGVTITKYDERGDRVLVVRPTGAVERFEYNDRHQLTRSIDAAGYTWEREYDARGLLVAAAVPTGERWEYHHDERGDLVGVEDPLKNRRTSRWDEAGNRVAFTDENGHTTEYEYDEEGRLTARISPRGLRAELSYDPLDNVREVRLSDGTVRRYARNVYGQLTEYVDEHGRGTRWRYASCGQLVEAVKPNGTRIQVEWSRIPDQKTAVVNELGERQQLEYDADGRVVRVADFSGRETRYEYDPAGNTTAVVDAAGKRVEYRHDPGGAVVEASYGPEKKTTFAYDPRGYLIAADNGACPVEMELDALGQVVAEKQGEYTVTSRYDALGRRTRRSTSLGYTVDFGWTPAGQLESLAWDPYHSVEFSYDAFGHEVARESPRGARIAHTYDERGRRIAQDVTSSGQNLGRRAGKSAWSPHRRYRYDQGNSLLAVEDDLWGTTTYRYDGEGRITSARLAGNLVERFRYDPLDNIRGHRRVNGGGDGAPLEETWRYAPGSQLTEREGVRYEYDAAGRLARKLEGGLETQYFWDEAGQLARVRLPGGDEWQYRYDAFGRRVSKTGPRGTTAYAWDGDHLLHEVEDPGTPREKVVHWEMHPQGFEPIAKVEEGVAYLCVNDTAGMPREMLAADGTVVWAVDFTTFGETRSVRTAEVSCPVRFQGQWYDAETGLHYNRFRYYDPATGRYLSPDPLGLAAGHNPYCYAPNPLLWIDPLGLIKRCGAFPPGAVIVTDKSPVYVVYEINGEKRIRFKADEAYTLQHATPGRNYTTDNLAGVNDMDKPYVLEGRHRSVGVARYGDKVPEDLGGVPSAPGYLDYEYTDKKQKGGVPVKSLTIDRGKNVKDVSKDEADKIFDKRVAGKGSSATDVDPTDVDSNASPTNQLPSSNSPTNKVPDSNSPTNKVPTSGSPTNKIW